jgi:hypothetical protein
MTTFSASPHRSIRRALADQLAPAALRTRPNALPLVDDEPTGDPPDLPPIAIPSPPKRS